MTGPAAPPPPSPPGPTGPGRHLRAAVESATPAAGASTYPVVVDAPTGAPEPAGNGLGGPVPLVESSLPFVVFDGNYGYDSCPNCAPGYDCERGVYAVTR